MKNTEHNPKSSSRGHQESFIPYYPPPDGGGETGMDKEQSEAEKNDDSPAPEQAEDFS